MYPGRSLYVIRQHGLTVAQSGWILASALEHITALCLVRSVARLHRPCHGAQYALEAYSQCYLGYNRLLGPRRPRYRCVRVEKIEICFFCMGDIFFRSPPLPLLIPHVPTAAGSQSALALEHDQPLIVAKWRTVTTTMTTEKLRNNGRKWEEHGQ